MTRHIHASLVRCGAILVLASCGARTELLGGEGTGGGSVTIEICNGLDDDENGAIDEGLGNVECGVGACRVSVPACDHGQPATCVPSHGSPEICNGIDDDCNGAVDEGLGLERIAGPFTLDPALNYLAYGSIGATSTGFLFAYSTSAKGVFSGTLDAMGAPITTGIVLTDRDMANGLRLSRDETGFFAAYCGRFDGEDRAATAKLSDGGVFTEFGLRPPANNFCGAGTPDGIWTGQRHLFAWTDNSTFDVRLDRADESGKSLSTALLSPKNGDLYSHPRFAMSGDRVLLSYSVLVDQHFLLRVHRLNQLGEQVGGVVELTAPGGTDWSDAQLASVPGGGFYLVARNMLTQRIDARFDADGVLVSGPTLAVDGLHQHALIGDPAGGYVLVSDVAGPNEDVAVSRLDATGAVTASWLGKSDPGWALDVFGWPSVATSNGRIVVLYTALGAGTPDHPELRSVTFGCKAPN